MNKYYWFVMLDSVKGIFEWIGFFSLLFGVPAGGLLAFAHCSGELQKGFWERFRWIIIVPVVGFVSLIAGGLIPTTKQMAAIILLPKVVENKNITALPDKVVNLANEWIEEAGK